MKEYAECDSHTGTWGRGSSGCGHPVLSIAFSNSLFNVHHSSDPVSYISVALTICALIPCGHAARLSNGIQGPHTLVHSRVRYFMTGLLGVFTVHWLNWHRYSPAYTRVRPRYGSTSGHDYLDRWSISITWPRSGPHLN